MIPCALSATDATVRYGLLDTTGNINLPLAGTPFETIETFGHKTHLDKVQLLAPVEPRNIYGVGLNYVKHAQEVNMPLPTTPMLFMKPTSSIVGPDAPIVYPREGKTIHFEAEVAVVIGRTARRVSEVDARKYILGYTCGNDVSERVIQKAEMGQGCLVVSKGFDSFNPLGPGSRPISIRRTSRSSGASTASRSRTATRPIWSIRS